MKTNIKIILLIVTGVFLLTGCKKPQNNVTGGGKGGNGIIAVSPDHHGLLFDSCAIYIKYGTLDEPANGQYDDSILPPLPLIDDTVPVAVFRGLTPGLYYFYGVGYHAAYSVRVRGAVPFTKHKDDSSYVVVTTGDY